MVRKTTAQPAGETRAYASSTGAVYTQAEGGEQLTYGGRTTDGRQDSPAHRGFRRIWWGTPGRKWLCPSLEQMYLRETWTERSETFDPNNQSTQNKGKRPGPENTSNLHQLKLTDQLPVKNIIRLQTQWRRWKHNQEQKHLAHRIIGPIWSEFLRSSCRCSNGSSLLR